MKASDDHGRTGSVTPDTLSGQDRAILSSASFDEVVHRATTGHGPYDYQRRLADEGLPDLLRVPTGGGKTLAATLPWLYRRRLHPDPEVRATTPHWLVFVLPMRVLVEQTEAVIRVWLEKLGLEAEVGLHVVMGGESKRKSAWRAAPEHDAIFVGTLDMLLSRALDRGYAESRFAWPIDFGLFNSGCQWVFDEVQLMGPALPTSRQMEGLRHKLGTAMPCRSMWMSATVDLEALATVDLPSVERSVELGDEDRAGPLRTRLEATKVVHRVDVNDGDTRGLAATLLEHHRPGTRTIAVLNTVERARELYMALRASGPDVVLLHSRFRPPDRRTHTDLALVQVDPSGPGRIVVATQVLEAGVDVSSATLFTEAAPWPSVVQRAGRCNREGEYHDAVLLWAPPPSPLPYEQADLDASVEALARLEGQAVSPASVTGEVVATAPVVHPVLRRRDLLDLFDTAPDLAGNDVDIGRFLREGDDLDVPVAWWDVDDEGPADDRPGPGRDERCPVPIGQVRKALARGDGRQAWRFDHLDGRWVRCRPADIRPGRIVVFKADQGGYRAETGWEPSSRLPVPIVSDQPAIEETESLHDDPLTLQGRWVALADHLAHVEAAVRDLARALGPQGLSADHIEAAAVAGRLHDIGKAHEVFQASLEKQARDPEELASVASLRPWAKSGGSGRLHHERRNFRHELASALALLSDARVGLSDLAEPDLVVYLVAAHHGKIRVGIRSLPGDAPCPQGARTAVLGVCPGEALPGIEVPGGSLPSAALDLSVMELGDGPGGRPSWTQRALVLRDRADLGPFRLAFLEALVRLADWKSSAAEARGEL